MTRASLGGWHGQNSPLWSWFPLTPASWQEQHCAELGHPELGSHCGPAGIGLRNATEWGLQKAFEEMNRCDICTS